MSDSSGNRRTKTWLLEENKQLRLRLEEAEQTLESIRNGEVDALVIAGPLGEQVYTLTGAEHVYRVIVETMNEAAVMVDPGGTILFCNQRFCDLMKTHTQNVLGRKVTAFAAPAQRSPLSTLLADAQVGPVQRHLTLQATDGTAVSVQLSASLLLENDTAGICLVASDLTEIEASASSVRVLRKHDETLQEANEQLRVQAKELQTQAEELQIRAQALRESEERFRTLADHMSQFAWMADKDGWLFWYNQRWYEYTGTTFEEMQGWGWQKVHHPDHVQRVAEKFRRHLQTGEVWEDIFPLRGEDGTYRWFLSRAVPVRDEQGKVLRWFGTNTDITEQRKADEALRELTRTLETRVAQRTQELQRRALQLQKLTLQLSQAEDRERKRLAEVLHDDLQQLLVAATFHLSMLSRRVRHDPSQRAISAKVDQILHDAIEKARGLSHELSPAVLHHTNLVETFTWLAGQVKAKHGLIVRVDAFSEVTVQSDALNALLYKAAQEMLLNVVKHARVNEARIRVRRVGRCVCLSVSDHGRGFDPRKLGETAGFGLLNLRERIELLGGRIKINSARGKGVTVHIVVPDGDRPGTDVQVKARPNGRTKGGKVSQGPSRFRLRVLLADDHKIVREGMASLLQEEANILVVGQAANGREAVDLADRLRPDVVVIDVAMPLINGDEATRQIKTHLPQTRVIALSMHEESDMVERMHRAGAESYVLKTAPSEELLAAIRGQAQKKGTQGR
jgi:PAS domain S-box-containing protein